MKSPTFILLCCPSLMLQFVGRDVSGTLLDFVSIWIILSAQWCNKSDRHSCYSSHPHWVVSCEWFTSTRIEEHPWIIIGFEHHAVVYKKPWNVLFLLILRHFTDLLILIFFGKWAKTQIHISPAAKIWRKNLHRCHRPAHRRWFQRGSGLLLRKLGFRVAEDAKILSSTRE